MYPSILIVLVIALMVFLVTYVVPSFAGLYTSMSAKLPAVTQILIDVGTTAQELRRSHRAQPGRQAAPAFTGGRASPPRLKRSTPSKCGSPSLATSG